METFVALSAGIHCYAEQGEQEQLAPAETTSTRYPAILSLCQTKTPNLRLCVLFCLL